MKQRSSTVAFVAVLLAGALGHAAWQPAGVPGRPTDLQVHDAGVISITSTSGVFEGVYLIDGGTPATGAVLVSNPAGGFRDARGCVAALLSNGTITWSSVPCGTASAPLPDGKGMRHTLAGSGYAVGWDGFTFAFVYSPTGGTGGGWVPVADPGGLAASAALLSSKPLSALRIGATDHSLVVVEGLTQLLFATDAQLVRAFDRGGAPKDVWLFDNGGAPGAFVVPSDGGLEQVANISLAPPAFTPVTLPGGAIDVGSAAFSLSGGDAFGRGFGMATGRTSGARDVFRPLPHPSQPGALWLRSPATLPGALAAGDFKRVACIGAEFCAAIIDAVGGNNVLVYWNQSPPNALALPTLVANDQGPAQFSVDAGDDDGDPVFVTWTPNAAGYPLTLQPIDPSGATVQVTPTPNAFCGTSAAQFPFTVTLSDGLAAHNQSIPAIIEVRHTAPPAMPNVTPASTTVRAGEGATALAASPGVGGCAPDFFTAREVTSLGLSVAVDGGSVLVTPPDTFCEADGGLAQVEVAAVDLADASVPAVVSVQLLPWGTPRPPVLVSPATQIAGQTESYGDLDAGHVCAAANGFPGVQTEWTVAAGGSIPGVSFRAGGVSVSPPGFSGRTVEVVSSDACVSGQLRLEARNRMNDGTGQVSAASEQIIDLVKVLDPIEDAGFSMSGAYNVARTAYEGALSTTANCPGDRGLSGRLLVTRDGGLETSSDVALPPGTFSVPIPSGCNGGDFIVTAELFADGGATGKVVSDSFTALFLPAGVGEVGPRTISAACGAGARGTISMGPPPAGFCPTPQVQWAQLSGPAMELVSEPGGAVRVQSAQRELEGLLGQSFELQTTALAAPGNQAQGTTRVQVIADPLFAEVAHRLTTPIASSAEPIGVEIVITNPTDCALSGVRFQESLDGLKAIAGSVRASEGRVVAEVQDETLLVDGIALPARGTVRVSYSARLPLLGNPRPTGFASIHGVPISNVSGLGEERAPTGCGCGAGGGLWPWGALLLLWLARRNRGQSPISATGSRSPLARRAPWPRRAGPCCRRPSPSRRLRA